LAACALVLVACGPSSYSDFRSQLTARWCDREVRCGAVAASQRAACDLPAPVLELTMPGIVDVVASVSAGRMQYHSDNAQSCLDALSSAPCDRLQAEYPIVAHCHDVVGPNVANGSACYGSEECVGGVCVGAASGCAGICTRYAAPGAPCVVSGGTSTQTCDPTVQFCDGMVCERKKHGGEACAADFECAFDLACVSNVCADPARLGQGVPCTVGMAPACADGLYCDDTAKTCAARVAHGAACMQADACSDGQTCVGGVCAAWLDAGGNCSVGGGGCPATQRCSNGACVALSQLPAGVNQSCRVDSDCVTGLYCGSTICQWQAGQDGVCSVANSCATGLMCDSGFRCRASPMCPAGMQP
jgi:hypothetical protein